MKPYVDWLNEDGFYVQRVWDIEKGEWIETGGNLQLFPHQTRILGHVFTPDANGKLPYKTVIYSDLKKSGKTCIGASLACWAADQYPAGSEIYLVANDLDQASYLLYGDVKTHVLGKNICLPTEKSVIMPNGSVIQPIAQHYTSAAGGRQAVTFWDELWGYLTEKSQRMWSEMTLPPTIPNAMRVIVTYAGYENESHLLWDLYEKAFINGKPVPGLEDIVDENGDPVCRHNGDMFVYWNTVPRMPWQTPEYYESELATLRPSDFLRMHKNRWTTSKESFIPIEMYDRCTVLPGPLTDLPKDSEYVKKYQDYPMAVAVDIGTKHDCCAVVGGYSDGERNKIGLSFHKIFEPRKGEILDIENTVEAELINLKSKYHISAVLYDPSQFQRSAVSLSRKGFPMVEFPQTEGPMTAATSTLYTMITNRSLEVYLSDDLRDHIRFATAQATPRGFRLMKGKQAKNKIDAAVAMAMMLYYLVNHSGLDLAAPITIECPFSDISSMRIPTIDQLMLPEELRSNPVEEYGSYT